MRTTTKVLSLQTWSSLILCCISISCVHTPSTQYLRDSAVHPTAKETGTRRPANDPIERLRVELSASLLWTNGTFPSIQLPPTATHDQVLDRVFALTSFDQGLVTRFTVVDRREVTIPDGTQPPYQALLLDTNLGRKIVLIQYQGPAIGWWSRVFDVP